jgi:tyrosyl-tRNA synthetase
VWLDPDMVSPYDYWQYWRNTEDADVARFLKLFTVLPLPEIEQLASLKDAEINEAKKVLATEATTLVHGRAAAEQAAATARTTFEEGAISEGLPTAKVPLERFKEGLSIADAVILAGFCISKSEVRRAIANNSIALNDHRVSTYDLTISENDLSTDGVAKLSFGRKRHVLLKPV